MDQDERVLRELFDRGGFEPSKTTHYHAHRPGRSEVTLEVRDAGEGKNTRFSVCVRDDSGHVGTGRPKATLEEALECVNWGQVDMADKRPSSD